MKNTIFNNGFFAPLMLVAVIFYVSIYFYFVLISAVAKESFEEGYKAEYGKTLKN